MHLILYPTTLLSLVTNTYQYVYLLKFFFLHSDIICKYTTFFPPFLSILMHFIPFLAFLYSLRPLIQCYIKEVITGNLVLFLVLQKVPSVLQSLIISCEFFSYPLLCYDWYFLFRITIIFNHEWWSFFFLYWDDHIIFSSCINICITLIYFP